MPDALETAMAHAGIQGERLHKLNTRSARNGDYILYWMQQSQRVHWNHALEYAILRANAARLPVVVLFVITANFPEANLRHYYFMAQGLGEIAKRLKEKGLGLVIRRGDPPSVAGAMAKTAAELICDMGYTRIQRKWRTSLAQSAPCVVTGVESDAVVPVETASGKAEYGARTIRPKIHKILERFLSPINAISPLVASDCLEISGLDPEQPEHFLSELDGDASVPPVAEFFTGGTAAALSLFDDFLNRRISRYATDSSQPQRDGTSRLSPYLHFGQISPVYMAWRVVNAADIPGECRDAFLEELVVRRDLAANFVHHTPNYDDYGCLPSWARKTLADHAKDRREHLYGIKTLEAAVTHDPYWNAAMTEMKVTGFMHNTMRMYWGKKILEWSLSPETAFQTLLTLNNTYFLDGRDPNSFAGVGWIFGLHDRAWPERPVFGKVRYMNAAGLERKYDINAYVQKIKEVETTAGKSRPKKTS